MKKTLISLATVLTLTGTVAPSAFAATSYPSSYKDISGNFAQQDILALSQKGIMHGYSDGTFRPSQIISRGQFLAYFFNLVSSFTGVKPVAHAQYYSDIPPRNWDYNYVGAAQAYGWIVPSWIGVKVGGHFNENYRASWGDAASFVVGMLKSDQLMPNMHGLAPLAWAKTTGLFSGIPLLENHVYLDRASAAVVLMNIYNYIQKLQNGGGSTSGGSTSGGSTSGGSTSGGSTSGGSTSGGSTTPSAPQGATLTLSGNPLIQSNATDQLTLVMKDGSGNVFNYGTAAVTYATGSNNAFVSPTGVLVATQPGTYQITATVDGVKSNTLSVTVVGPAAGVQLAAATNSLVVGGSATDLITATIVDAGGNPVTNFNGTLEFRDTMGQLLNASGVTTNDLTGVQVVNGKATVSIRSTNQLGSTDTITATNIIPAGSSTVITTPGGVASANVTVTQVQQQASSIKITPTSNSVENNISTEDGFSIQVVDQSGQPIMMGSYPLTITVSGAGTLDPGTPTSTYYVGNGNAANEVMGNIWSKQGVAGPITIQVSSPGLQAATATVQSVTVGAPTALRLSVDPTSNSTFAAGGSGSLFDISAVDANNNPVSESSSTTYTATIWQGANQVTSGVTAQVVQGKVLVSGTVAGTYTLKVASSDNLTAGMTTFTITAGAATKAVLTQPSGSLTMPITSDTTTLQAQLEDAYGNPVDQAGVPIEFVDYIHAGSDAATVGGSTTGTVTALTNGNGIASTTFVGTQKLGDAWTVGVDKVSNVSVPVVPTMISMVQEVPTSLQVALQDVVTYGGNSAQYLHSTSYAQSGDSVQVSVSALDAYGHPSSNGDTVQITLPSGFTNPTGLTQTATNNVYTAVLPSTGTLTFTVQAAQAGTFAIQAMDLSVPGQSLTGTQSMTIVPGTAVKAALFDAAGEITTSNPLSVTSNVPVQVWLKPIDSQGNPVNEGPNGMNVTLSDNGANGQFRLDSPSGVNVTSVQITAGESVIPVYYVNANTGNYVLTVN